MNNGDDVATAANVTLARKCLGLIRDIAARAAGSANPEHIGYALQEISQVLFERLATEERLFEPVPAGQIDDLEALKVELDWVDCSSQDMAASETGKRNGYTAFGNSLN